MKSAKSGENRVRSLLQDQVYVIKEIDTSKLPKSAALEALHEIELLGGLDSHFIVEYFDSFITGSMINIIMEYC